MKDSVLLLITAAGASVFAWMFWNLLGKIGYDLLAIVAIAMMVADNWRLRRKLRERSDNKRNESGCAH